MYGIRQEIEKERDRKGNNCYMTGQDQGRTGQDRNVSGMDDRSIGEGIDNQEKKKTRKKKRYQAVEC